MDYGEKGLFDTIDALDSCGIVYVGAGKDILSAREPKTIKVKNKRVSFLAYSEIGRNSFFADYNKTGVV